MKIHYEKDFIYILKRLEDDSVAQAIRNLQNVQNQDCFFSGLVFLTTTTSFIFFVKYHCCNSPSRVEEIK